MDRYVVTNFNYLAASLVSLAIILINDRELPGISFLFTHGGLSGLVSPVGSSPDPKSSLLCALVVGIPVGLFFFLSFNFAN